MHAFRRRGVVAIKFAILSVVLIGFVALGVDIGVLYNAKAELQRAVDACSKAGIDILADDGSLGNAKNAIEAVALLNPVAGEPLTIFRETDIEFGWAEFDPATGDFAFDPASNIINAIRVIGRRIDDEHHDGAITLFFANVLGIGSKEMSISSLAWMAPRDIVMVADISASHNNDSELRNVDNFSINLWEVWNSLFERGVWPGWADTDDQSKGWGWGFFKLVGRGFGYDSIGSPTTALVPNEYDPNRDVGLVHLPAGIIASVHWDQNAPADPAGLPRPSDYAEIESYLQNLPSPYSGSFGPLAGNLWNHTEIDAIMGDYLTGMFSPAPPAVPGFPQPLRLMSRGMSNWSNRMAVATGFAHWNSGIPGGRWQALGMTMPVPAPTYFPLPPQGNYGDDWLHDEEMIWGNALLPNRTAAEMKQLWYEYAVNYVKLVNSKMTTEPGGNSKFTSKVGIKTFVNFLLEKKYKNADIAEFVDSMAQPMHAEKIAFRALADSLSSGFGDQLALVTYAGEATVELELNLDLQAAPVILDARQAGHVTATTNIGAGILKGVEALNGPDSREVAMRMMILLTDGVATASSDAALTPANFAREQADAAAAENVKVFAISVGADYDWDLMDYIADTTGGLHYHVDRETYDAQGFADELRDHLLEIASIRTVALID